MLDKTRDTFNPVIRPPRVSNIVAYSLPGNCKLEEEEQREILIYFSYFICLSLSLYTAYYIFERKRKFDRFYFVVFFCFVEGEYTRKR